ncbi:PREDICTED: uncharacterized protein LOC109189854 [Ipomoea nil]|uniref:uncharacterized protein LOC109189854 n=1 Tax=Ipomoea nil TaxID=35883 RepID=UPI0009014819|nr:PREDICTED: uncharacterized protein LOC109189854 [Ipomoea nil]
MEIKASPRIKLFFWQLCTSSLPTVDPLRVKRVQGCSTLLEWLESNFNVLTDNQICFLISICWKIWEARNDKVWNHVITSRQVIINGAQSYINEWHQANFGDEHSVNSPGLAIHWSKPPTGWLKMNIDAALGPNNSKMGFGFVLRDSIAEFKAAVQLPYHSLCRPDEAEAMAVREALKWLKAQNMDFVQLESDCIKVVNSMQGSSTTTYFDLIMQDIRDIAREFCNLSFLFVKRSANRVTHLLARETLSKSDRVDCFSVSFPFVVHALELDSR